MLFFVCNVSEPVSGERAALRRKTAHASQNAQVKSEIAIPVSPAPLAAANISTLAASLALMIPFPDAIKKAIDVLQKKAGRVNGDATDILDALDEENKDQ